MGSFRLPADSLELVLLDTLEKICGCKRWSSHLGPEFVPVQKSVIWSHLRNEFYQQFLLK